MNKDPFVSSQANSFFVGWGKVLTYLGPGPGDHDLFCFGCCALKGGVGRAGKQFSTGRADPLDFLSPARALADRPLLRNRFCWAMIKIREEIDDIAEGRVAMEQR